MSENSDIIPIDEIKKLSQKAMEANAGIMDALVKYDHRDSDRLVRTNEAYQPFRERGMSLLSSRLLEGLTIVGNVG